MNNLKEISVFDFFKYYQKNTDFKIIDVRDLYEYDSYHIHGSLNIPSNLLIDKPHLFIKKDIKYYIICQNGTRSKTTTIALANKGFNVINIVEGIDKWPGLLVASKRFKL